MADVRLTATNPEDSSVVPVACDAGGRLLLEEMPPAFDGTVDGDLTVSGKSTFAGGKSIIGNDGSAQFAQGAVDIYANGTVEFTQDVTFRGPATFVGSSFDVDGRAAFLSRVDVGSNSITDNVALKVMNNYAVSGTATLYVQNFNNAGNVWSGRRADNEETSAISATGSATFAGNKAGFTAEGYLWCTTRRGDTVVLDATSNGLASWVEYTPTSRIEEIRDKLDANRGDTGEMPADTP